MRGSEVDAISILSSRSRGMCVPTPLSYSCRVRAGKVIELGSDNMVLGVDPDEESVA